MWCRVASFLRPEDADLIRVAGYVFHSRIAQRWREGRALLAVDAAHQMPPFAGQGMCSGVRDAQNIAFKLDLVLRDRAHPDLLDTYQSEREPQVRWVVEKAIELGRIQTLRDPVAAAERDRRLIAQRAATIRPGWIRLPGIGDGFLARHSGPGRGELSVQGFVDDGAGRRRLDDVIGHGFHLLATDAVMARLIEAGQVEALEAAGVAVLGLGAQAGPHAVVDSEDTYRTWFAELGCVAVAVRPDFYVYGTAADTEGALDLAGELCAATTPERHPVPR